MKEKLYELMQLALANTKPVYCDGEKVTPEQECEYRKNQSYLLAQEIGRLLDSIDGEE